MKARRGGARVRPASSRPPRPSALVRKLEFPLRAPTVRPRGAPTVGTHTGGDYDTDWARRFPARWGRAVLLESVIRPAVAAVAQPERRGLDRLSASSRRSSSPPTTTAMSTPACCSSSLPEPFRYKVFTGAAADYFFRTRVRSALAALALNAIPIERIKVTRRSADQAAALIDDGWSMVIFPEGGRSPDGWGQPFRGGAAYLAIRCGVPVVPVHLQGTGRILPKGGSKHHSRRAGRWSPSGDPLWPAEGENVPAVRRPPRARGRGPGRRGDHRLVLGPPAGPRRHEPRARRPRRRGMAPQLGARRSAQATWQDAEPSALARPRSEIPGTRGPGYR